MTRPARKMTLLDLMILVAAMALGFKIVRDIVPGVAHMVPTGPDFWFLMPRWLMNASILILASWPLPAMVTIALLLIRIRAPRPTLRRLARQPGFVAGLAVTMISLCNALMLLAAGLRVGETTDLYPFTAIPIGAAVLVAWVTLLSVGRWNPQHDFLDRAGRVLGCYWIAMFPLAYLVVLGRLGR